MATTSGGSGHDGERDLDPQATATHVNEVDLTPVGFDQRPDYGEAQARPGSALVTTPEPAGGPLLVGIGKARAAVSHCQNVSIGSPFD